MGGLVAPQADDTPGCQTCAGMGPEPGLIEMDNNGPIVACPVCGPDAAPGNPPRQGPRGFKVTWDNTALRFAWLINGNEVDTPVDLGTACDWLAHIRRALAWTQPGQRAGATFTAGGFELANVSWSRAELADIGRRITVALNHATCDLSDAFAEVER